MWFILQQPLQTDSIIPEPDTDENLGPMEPPFPSMRYQRNFSVCSIGRYHQWNTWAVPGQLYPNLPHDPILPSEAKFVGSQVRSATASVVINYLKVICD